MKSIKFYLNHFFYFIFFQYAFSRTLNKIEIIGNDRISDETIKLFFM